VNEGLTHSTYSLSHLSLPFISSLTIVTTGTCIIEIWIGKGMIFKPIPLLNGLTGLVMTTCRTIDGDARTLLLVPISTNIKFKGSYLKSRKMIWYACNSSW